MEPLSCRLGAKTCLLAFTGKWQLRAGDRPMFLREICFTTVLTRTCYAVCGVFILYLY